MLPHVDIQCLVWHEMVGILPYTVVHSAWLAVAGMYAYVTVRHSAFSARVPHQQPVLCNKSDPHTKMWVQAGGNVAATRYGLHSHGQYIDFKQGVVYSGNPDNEITVSYNGVACDFTGIIPDNILSLRASDLLNIMGRSLSVLSCCT